MPLGRVDSAGSTSVNTIHSIQNIHSASLKPAEGALLESDVVNETYLEDIFKLHGQWIYPPIPLRIKYENLLFWMEHPDVATLPVRIEFINKVVEQIEKLIPDYSKPLIIVSMGAGGLLTDDYIYGQLIKAGYSDIRYRAIDVGYAHSVEKFFVPQMQDVYHYPKEIPLNFMKDKPDAKCFVSEQAYLCEKMEDGSLLVDRDLTQGKVVG
jgi:hypothetical protein